ncbi:MAG: hypothetical protein ABSE43_14280 [Steroidobacteraceae bacterium]|jgi:hypothetical protein
MNTVMSPPPGRRLRYLLRRAALLVAAATACAVAAAASASTEGGAPQSWNLRAGPVRAEARLLHQDPAGAQSSGQYVFAITVHGDAGDQFMTTAIRASSLDEAVKIVRAASVWRAPYLFVHLDRGVGNRPDGRREAVFEVLNGKLLSLGQLIDLGDGLNNYHGRHFVDYWVPDSAQQLSLCRDCSPVMRIQLVDRDGHLEVQRSVTWSANQDSWLANAQVIAHPPADVSGDTQDSADSDFAARLSYFQAVVKNAMLAKYCGKTADLLDLLNMTAPHLNAEQRQDLRDSLAMLAPLTPPSEARPALYALNVEVKSTP